MPSSPPPSGAPVSTAGAPSDGPGLSSQGADEPIRVLVVDNDGRVRAAISQTIALEADLLMVGHAADAATALAWAERSGPAVALVDVLLPDDATGLALVRSLSQRLGCGVVAMSVRSGLRGAALGAGAVAFVEKGSDIDAVLAARSSGGTLHAHLSPPPLATALAARSKHRGTQGHLAARNSVSRPMWRNPLRRTLSSDALRPPHTGVPPCNQP